MSDFWKSQIDKIILVSLFLILVGVAVWLQLRPGMDEGALDWARHNGDLAIGALLGLITGKVLTPKPETTDIVKTTVSHIEPEKLPEGRAAGNS